jgi:hypothetical protein
MKNILLSLITFFGAVFVGGCVNMGIITFGGQLIPAPSGVNPADVNSISENMHLYGPIHFLSPFLAHAVGTLMGAYLVARFAPVYKFVLALFVGGLFLLGGIMMVMMLPSPMWFNILDLGLAYIPMGYLGWWLNQPKTETVN